MLTVPLFPAAELAKQVADQSRVGDWLTAEEEIVLTSSWVFIAELLLQHCFASPLLCYVAAQGMKQDGSWQSLPHMTSFLASLTYVIVKMVSLIR